MTENPSLVAARTLVATLIAADVPAVAYCPGSRNAPFAYALAQAEDDHRLEVATFGDERSAGFWALGYAKAAGAPVAVVTTSGTAVSELHPAVLEASHQEVPLVIITADRPHSMRGVGASQTTAQEGIFGCSTFNASIPADVTAMDQTGAVLARLVDTVRREPGPAHLNVAFADPLIPATAAPLPRVVVPKRVISAKVDPVWEDLCQPDLATVVIAGDSADPGVLRAAELRAVPIFSEPTSGLSSGGAQVPHASELLRSFAETRRIEQVVVSGSPTLTRPVARLLADPGVRKVVCSRNRVYPDVSGSAAVVAEGMRATEPKSPPASGWLDSWQAAAGLAQEAIWEVAGSSLNLVSAANLIWDSSQEADLWLAASNTVRAFDLVASGVKDRRIYANRGLAGIDGSLATAMGVAQGNQQPVRAVVGDLAFAADVSSLAQRPGSQVRLQVIVLNDQGGGIFASLEHGGAPPNLYERFFAVAPNIDVTAAAQAAGWKARKATTLEELESALSAPVQGLQVIEVPIPRPADLLSRVSERIAEVLGRFSVPS